MIDPSNSTAEFYLPPSSVPLQPPDATTSLVRVEFGAASDPGKVRENNEDSYLIYRAGRYWEPLMTNLPPGALPARHEERAYVMAVADGMGGKSAGEVASAVALRAGVNLVLRAAQWGLKFDDPGHRERELRAAEQQGKEFFRRIDRTVTEQSESDPALSGMGTTLTVSYSVGRDLFIVHLGDSRAYLFRDNTLQQLTRDHTMTQFLVELGELTEEEAQDHYARNVLMKFIGGKGGQARAEVRHLLLEDGDWLLLCTDGLTDLVNDERIGEILREAGSPPVACSRLVTEALNAGGRDNVTVTMARYHIPPTPDESGQADHSSDGSGSGA